MAQSDARFEYRAKLGRTDHNLSQPFGFTAAPGMLLPIWFDFATPGDAYYMHHDLPLLRSIQLLAPAMVDVKVHYETFFVPLQMIYQPSENVLFSLKQLQSNNFNPASLLNKNFPLLDLATSAQAIRDDGDTSLHQDAFRLADLLGFGAHNFAQSNLQKFTPAIFPYQLLAYQTIFNYYYRLDDKTVFDGSLCNVDSFYSTNVITHRGLYFEVHQRPWDFDYFTSLYRSPIVSNENMQFVMGNGQYSNLLQSASSLEQLPIRDNGNPSSSNSVINAFSMNGSSSFSQAADRVGNSTALIRQLFANEKLAMITGRTRKNYDSQVLAHFGVTVPHDVKHDLTMIHHDEFDLNVQEVTSLASTDDAPLGEIAGKSYSAGRGEQFKFTAPCHGVVMTIFSIEPKKRYITGFDRINAITNAFDLPTPEFDRLGNMPMFRYECGVRNEVPVKNNSDIIGWKERYYQFKRKPARCTWAFYSNNGHNNYASYFLNSFAFGSSALPRQDSDRLITSAANPRPEQASPFYIERGCLDNLCQMTFYDGWMTGVPEEEGEAPTPENWNHYPYLAYARDPFIVNSHIKCKKVSWMSKDGEPIYNF